MNFKDATDEITRRTGLTLADVARAYGIEPPSLTRWRTGAAGQAPREGWEAILAALAEDQARKMDRRAEELRALAGELRRQ